MTAFFDDAAASDRPPRADVGPAVSSFPGTPGRRPPEDSPMPQHPPAHDETVRMRGDRPDGRPPLNGSRSARREEADDTRPVTRDWLLGAPEAGAPEAAAPEAAAAAPVAAPVLDDAGTEKLDLADLDRVPEAGSAVLPAAAQDGDGAGSDDPLPGDGPPAGDEPPADGSGRPRWRRGAILAPAGAVL